MEALLECVITRASPPCNPIAIALSLNLLGVKSLNACVRAGKSVDSFTRKYTRSLNTLLRLEVVPEAPTLFRGGVDRTYVLACQTSTSLSVPGRGPDAARPTHPISMIHRDIHTRRYGSIPEKLHQRKQKDSVTSPIPPKVMRTVHIGATSSSQSSVVTSAPVRQHVRNTPKWSFVIVNHNSFFKIFIRSTGGRTFTVPTVDSRDTGEGRHLTTPTLFDQESDEGEIPPRDTESIVSRDASPSKLGDRKEFDLKLKNAAWELANEFSATSSLLVGMYKAQVPKGKITLLVIDALSVRGKSAETMKGIANHASGLVQYYMDTREESKVQLTGRDSVVLIRDFLESLAERGRTVPASDKHALTVWAEALSIDWPLTHTLVCSAAAVDSNGAPKQATSMSLSTLRALWGDCDQQIGHNVQTSLCGWDLTHDLCEFKILGCSAHPNVRV